MQPVGSAASGLLYRIGGGKEPEEEEGGWCAETREATAASQLVVAQLAAHDARDARHLRSEVNSELNFSPNFEGLVLGCIDADFCK